MDSSKTIEDSPADTKESEGKTEHCQVNTLCNRRWDAAVRSPARNHAAIHQWLPEVLIGVKVIPIYI